MRLAWSGTAATILARALPSTVGRGRCFEYSNADLRLAARGYGEFDALCLRPVIRCDRVVDPANEFERILRRAAHDELLINFVARDRSANDPYRVVCKPLVQPNFNLVSHARSGGGRAVCRFKVVPWRPAEERAHER